MPLNEPFLAARAAEHANRLLTHLGLAAPLVLPLRRPRRFRRAFAVPQRLLTERMRLELILAQNAFFTARRPLLGDVFNVLWRLHPEFRRPHPLRVGLVRDLGARRFRLLRLWRAFGSLRTARAHRWLSRHVAACDLFAAEKLIVDRLALAEQDAPGAPWEPGRHSAVAPPFCYFDDLAVHLARSYGVPVAAALDLPRALVHQLWRAEQLAQPDGELNVFAPSDRLLAPARSALSSQPSALGSDPSPFNSQPSTDAAPAAAAS